LEVVIVSPMISTQTKSPRSKNSHDVPTARFQVSKSVKDIPDAIAIVSHSSPLMTKWKAL